MPAVDKLIDAVKTTSAQASLAAAKDLAAMYTASRAPEDAEFAAMIWRVKTEMPLESLAAARSLLKSRQAQRGGADNDLASLVQTIKSSRPFASLVFARQLAKLYCEQYQALNQPSRREDPSRQKTSATEAALIELRDVTRIYRRDMFETFALSSVTLTVPRGSFMAVHGPSGAGKTTLMHIIGGLEQPTSGTIAIGGQQIYALASRHLARWRARHVGFVLDLIPGMDVYHNVEVPLLLTELSKDERQRHVHTALELLGLSHRMRHLPDQLSVSQQQRAAIARAIVTDPVVLLADEPTRHLDDDAAAELIAVLRSINKEYGLTIVIATDDSAIATRADQVAHLHKGYLSSTDTESDSWQQQRA